MKAATISKWGSPEVFQISEIEKPVPNSNQVLIQVYASSINPVDWKHRTGFHKYILGAPFPIVLGYDVCGKVVETGDEISRFKVGDIVFGDLDNKYGGGLAEFALGHEKCFSIKPAHISNEEAAAFPLVSLTVLQALRDKAKLKPGQTVLINGASGGVGHIAVQISRIMGARVIAVASGKNEEFLNQFSPDRFIDYKTSNILECDEKVDIFFDVIGNYSFRKTRFLLKPNGTYVSTLPRPKILFHKLFQLFSQGKKVKTVLRKHSEQDMHAIAEWINAGKLKIHIDKTFNLEEIVEAHRYAEKGRTKGKNIIVISKHEE